MRGEAALRVLSARQRSAALLPNSTEFTGVPKGSAHPRGQALTLDPGEVLTNELVEGIDRTARADALSVDGAQSCEA